MKFTLKQLFRRLFKTKDRLINQRYKELCDNLLYNDKELESIKRRDSEILYKQALQHNEAKTILINDIISALRKRYYGE